MPTASAMASTVAATGRNQRIPAAATRGDR